ncbi:ribonuclease H-like protein [Punctularia strigosozonata HHB-11173 SS5]|uniref:ribonuclease H-like protein n=1 Tax=Punctularia strigosozonata (strain HHB-11173) TaxID=741275 RepID=UPI0004416B25|nr:ribonuclease H-like protein [Punctularia strigosozonata HHB-11173 SS5]EIN06734.1 ribonuclease H-like protein [Punctularia strigosozonata HHB-11173 SS5]
MATSWVPRPMDFKAGPMVWIDCEMTGLDPKKDKIMEIAVIITNGDLQLVDDGVEYVVYVEKESLDGMDEWCTNQHGKSGLTHACLASPHSRQWVAQQVLEYIKKWVPERRTAVLAGNSVHADRAFLVEEMPEVVDWLHYRIVDVSSIKEVVRRWYPKAGLTYRYAAADSRHRALDDIKGSIRELQWYRENVFVPATALNSPPTLSTATKVLEELDGDALKVPPKPMDSSYAIRTPR